jgi:hypothetical protein
MKADHGRWPFLMVQLPWVLSLKKSNFIKPLGPSLGVNQMWTKRNEHVPKNEYVDFQNTCPKKPVLKTIKFDHSLVFSCLHLLFPKHKKQNKTKTLKFYHDNISLPWALAFSY